MFDSLLALIKTASMTAAAHSQQSKLSIQGTKMKWTETKYLPGPRILPSSITFNFHNMPPRNEGFVSSQEFIMNWIKTELLYDIEFRAIGLIYMKY